MNAVIVSGHGDASDVLFIVAAVLATVCAIATWAKAWPDLPAIVFGWAAVACLAVAWLVL